MNDLISRAAAKEAVHNTIASASTVVRIWNALDKIPAVDAAPVMHGRWYDIGSLSCRCTACGIKSSKISAYCPNCGAKMENE